MDNIDLNKLLHQLQDEIKNTQAVDDKGSELLRDLDGDIQKLLDRSEGTTAQLHPDNVQRLDGTLTYFEVTHPDLTFLISKLLDFLSNSGI